MNGSSTSFDDGHARHAGRGSSSVRSNPEAHSASRETKRTAGSGKRALESTVEKSIAPGTIGTVSKRDEAIPAAIVVQAPPVATGPTDEQLLASYRHGDRKGFGQLVQRYERELFHFLVRFLGDRAAAEDVFQEAFLQVHQSADQFDPSRRFRPWLFTIAANKARDLMRSQSRRPTNPLQASINPGDDESGEYIDLMQATVELPDAPLQQQELQAAVQKTVMGLPEHLREILLLSYFHQFPYKQIGDILEIPLGTVKSRLHAAVALFADRWRAANKNRVPS
jgi:RNA polymerase sigma-70 factor, ECF subfamily